MVKTGAGLVAMVKRMPMKRRFMIFVVVVASACNRTPPSAPSGVPPVQLVTRHFSGVVLTEDGGPVPAATVTFTPGNPGGWANATTDGNGFYQMALDQPASWAGTHARVTQALYEDTAVVVPWLPSQTDVTQNFRLYRSVTLAAGESAHLAITPDNSLCTGDSLGFVCRTVHVTVPSSGTLVLDTIADDPSNTFWLAIGDVDSFQKVTHLSRSMDTATTVVVMVLRPDNIVAGSFTLETAFAP
jgi:hypothetical protein